MDPNHGYNAAKILLRKRTGDKYYKEKVEKNCRVTITVENVGFEKIGDVWVATEADIKFDTRFDNGDFGLTQKKHKVTEITFNPDHTALGSFLTDDVREGTPVTIVGNDRVKYTWQNEKVVDETGAVIHTAIAGKLKKQRKSGDE